MVTTDINMLFARAERAFAAGQFDDARRDLVAIGRAAGDHPAVLHLLALVERRSGNIAAARQAFERAGALAPHDAKLLGNHANLLGSLGEAEAALALYARALAIDPAFADARYNRALLLQKLGRLDEALADLDAVVPPDARAHSARGSVLRALGRLDAASGAYDAALRLDPGRLTALHGRARTAMERGETGASDLYARALAQKPGDLELILGVAEALEAEGKPEGLDILKEAVTRNPDWVAGHATLARMRSEAGDGAGFADHYLPSLAARPADRALHAAHWRSLIHGGRHAEALAALHGARKTLPEDPDILLMEAMLAGETGDFDAAFAITERLGLEQPEVASVRGRAALGAGDAEQAGRLFERVVEADPASVNGWAHLDLAWRLIGDPRHDWLALQPRLFDAREIGLDESELARLVGLLRSLHVTRAHPIGQSLRGGTQTRGRLFARREPVLGRLREAIIEAVRGHFRALPPRDDRHPLLRHRDAEPVLAGSWSVRLTGQGFHVNHIHPEGILSSACYISLPEALGDERDRDGWLELGRPPAELGLPLEPIAVIEPKPGRLALFPSYLFHGTRPFADGERLTVAFDVVVR
ncbi:putative 2OG-Fe(II) oxygenase [Sphingosinicella sp. LHD-64]|uniref:tetratricopeptide repeat protein n=1 Tax=Sphingosinicella sp. LHD-64 TaxID=3072139 RepID=UPI00280E49A1|nr:putative 2OG-Fe(II) oxygenase [Sphingosinicella sp. LHD-64]MDQ8756473.1 putative 2OG-Fe(II) oxygenase [Sphingosinicella sp. LHD-64]